MAPPRVDPRAGRAGAVLEIDLDAIAGNWKILRKRVRDRTEVAAVVKADAYGLGMKQVAPALFAAGCRLFFVATLDEGLTLRKILPEAEIAILNGVWPRETAEFAQGRLMPVLNDLGQIETWRASAAAARGPAMLHIDTGMSRLGVPIEELAILAASPGLLDGVRLSFILSHLASADEAGSPRNSEQLQAFRKALRKLPKTRAGLAASSGIFLGAAYHLDMVRPGAALYGLNPRPETTNPMMQTISLKAKILQVRSIDRNRTVGYGAGHRMARSGRIATIAVGYADGWLRSASPRSSAGVAGRRIPVIGRISMDLMTLDVTGIAPELVLPGSYVDLLGADYGPDELARDAGTIGYEILTSLGRRHHRIYRGKAA